MLNISREHLFLTSLISVVAISGCQLASDIDRQSMGRAGSNELVRVIIDMLLVIFCLIILYQYYKSGAVLTSVTESGCDGRS